MMLVQAPGVLLKILKILSGSGSIFELEASCLANRLDVGRKERANQRGILSFCPEQLGEWLYHLLR